MGREAATAEVRVEPVRWTQVERVGPGSAAVRNDDHVGSAARRDDAPEIHRRHERHIRGEHERRVRAVAFDATQAAPRSVARATRRYHERARSRCPRGPRDRRRVRHDEDRPAGGHRRAHDVVTHRARERLALPRREGGAQARLRATRIACEDHDGDGHPVAAASTARASAARDGASRMIVGATVVRRPSRWIAGSSARSVSSSTKAPARSA